MKFGSTLATAALAAALVLAATPAHAHQIWIEQDAKGVAKLYFGEFAANLREDSPGLLDKLTGLVVRLLSAKGERPVTATRTATAFTLDGRAAAGESLVAEEGAYPGWEDKSSGKVVKTVWSPAARFVSDWKVQAPVLTLDIVPTGTEGEVQVVFRGKPLAKAEVEIVARSGWQRTIESDAEGKVKVALPWKGPYLVVVHHEDKTAGKRKGPKGDEAYDAASFVTTLSFATRKGLASPPPPPAAPPSE
jgi:uncharacterized GH25 family protein